MSQQLRIKKEAIIVITALVLSASTAWASGINNFTLAGPVAAVYCPQALTPEAAPSTDKYRPLPGCSLEISNPATGGSTQVICEGPSVNAACDWLQPGDRALILGNETPFGKVATHVALLLSDPRESGAAGEKRIPGYPSFFQLKLGQSIQYGGLRFQFLEVIEDSRCPEDVTCFWQGRVTVAIAVWEETAGEPEGTHLGDFNLTLGASPDPEHEVAGHRIRLEEVLPVPRTDRKLDPSGYSITLSVAEVPYDPCGNSLWCPPVE